MNPLVSVIISTYNSSSYILETLESVLVQTWNELELIITDDNSKDDTLDKCRIWINENGHRFSRVEIISSDKNTGVSANANRGLKSAKGDWIKFLGADDTLESRCIEDNMEWIGLHPEVKVLFSRIRNFSDTFSPSNMIDTVPDVPYNPEGILAPYRDATSQYRMLLTSDRIHFTPSVFINREVLASVGGFNEDFRMFEDYPLWLELTRNGYKLYFMEKVTVNYRRHSGAINNMAINYLIKPNYFKSESFRRVYTYPYLPWDIRLNLIFHWYAVQIFRIDGLNRNKMMNKLLMKLLTVYLNPFNYLIHFKKKFFMNEEEKDFYK